MASGLSVNDISYINDAFARLLRMVGERPDYFAWALGDVLANPSHASLTTTGVTTLNGQVVLASTDASGTPGAATINKPSGKIAIGESNSSVVLTNSLITATSIVVPVLMTHGDATATSITDVVINGSAHTATFNANAAATGTVVIGFMVIN